MNEHFWGWANGIVWYWLSEWMVALASSVTVSTEYWFYKCLCGKKQDCKIPNTAVHFSD